MITIIIIIISPEEKLKLELEESIKRKFFNPIDNSLCLGKKSINDSSKNSKISLPGPLGNRDEAYISLKNERMENAFNLYAKKNTKKGRQISNIPKQADEGMKSLMKRQKEGEINVCLTDKSSNWAVMEREIYLELGKAHTSKDELVDRSYLEKCAGILDGHSSSWVKMTG